MIVTDRALHRQSHKRRSDTGDAINHVPIEALLRQHPLGAALVALSDIDRSLLERCLANKPRAWEDFVDRFLGLVIHVINHTAQSRSILLSPADREDLVSEVMMAIVTDDMAVLRRVRGQSSLATYLPVIARRVVVRKMLENRSATPLGAAAGAAFRRVGRRTRKEKCGGHF